MGENGVCARSGRQGIGVSQEHLQGDVSYERGALCTGCSAVHHEMTCCFTMSDKREGFCHNVGRCHFDS